MSYCERLTYIKTEAKASVFIWTNIKVMMCSVISARELCGM